MANIEFVPSRDWVKILDSNLKTLYGEDVYQSEWHTDGIVMLNGWANVNNSDEPHKLQWRSLKRQNGEVIYTEVTGLLGSSTWKGQKVDFAKIGGIPRPSRPSAVGAIMNSEVGQDNTGFAYVSIDWKDNCLVLSAEGSRFGQYGGALDGWRTFHLMY